MEMVLMVIAHLLLLSLCVSHAYGTASSSGDGTKATLYPCLRYCQCSDARSNSSHQTLQCTGTGRLDLRTTILPPTLTDMSFIDVPITPLPAYVLQNATDLLQLSFQNNSITTLPPGLLHNATKLTTFKALDNLIASLPDGFFNFNTKLTYINMESNQIVRLPLTIVSHGLHLKYLGFEGNPLPLAEACPLASLSLTSNVEKITLPSSITLVIVKLITCCAPLTIHCTRSGDGQMVTTCGTSNLCANSSQLPDSQPPPWTQPLHGGVTPSGAPQVQNAVETGVRLTATPPSPAQPGTADDNSFTSAFNSLIGMAVLSGLLAAVLLFFAYWVHRKRRSEFAKQSLEGQSSNVNVPRRGAMSSCNRRALLKNDSNVSMVDLPASDKGTSRLSKDSSTLHVTDDATCDDRMREAWGVGATDNCNQTANKLDNNFFLAKTEWSTGKPARRCRSTSSVRPCNAAELSKRASLQPMYVPEAVEPWHTAALGAFTNPGCTCVAFDDTTEETQPEHCASEVDSAALARKVTIRHQCREGNERGDSSLEVCAATLTKTPAMAEPMAGPVETVCSVDGNTDVYDMMYCVKDDVMASLKDDLKRTVKDGVMLPLKNDVMSSVTDEHSHKVCPAVEYALPWQMNPNRPRRLPGDDAPRSLQDRTQAESNRRGSAALTTPKRGTAPSDAERGMAPGDAERGMAPGDAERGMASGDAERGTARSDAERGMAPGDAERGMAPGDAERGMAPGDAERGMAPGDAEHGMDQHAADYMYIVQDNEKVLPARPCAYEYIDHRLPIRSAGNKHRDTTGTASSGESAAAIALAGVVLAGAHKGTTPDGKSLSDTNSGVTSAPVAGAEPIRSVVHAACTTQRFASVSNVRAKPIVPLRAVAGNLQSGDNPAVPSRPVSMRPTPPPRTK